MMIDPKTYIDQYKNCSYEELLEQREELLGYIYEFEKGEGVAGNQIISPSPSVIYQCNLQYLAELCNLIADKYSEKQYEMDDD